VKSGGPGFASVAAREGERTAEEQRGEVTGGDENACEGLAKPASEKRISISFFGSQARASKVAWLGLT